MTQSQKEGMFAFHQRVLRAAEKEGNQKLAEEVKVQIEKTRNL